MIDSEMVSKLHFQIIHQLIVSGACPTNAELALGLACTESELEPLMQSLSDIHGVVLHPNRCSPWVIHPFSITPTLNWVERGQGGWWAPCVWCALGITALAPGRLRLHTRIGGERETLIVEVEDGELVSAEDIWVHFPIPPARAWDNVHEHCSMVLPFHTKQDIDGWCHRHQLPQGEAVPLPQVALLARNWYGTHARPDWRKWTLDEAQRIFRDSGFTSSFWNLGSGTGKF